MNHISDHDLERYHLGMIVGEAELAPLEEHLLSCPGCAERAEQVAEYVDTMRAAIIARNFDLEWDDAIRASALSRIRPHLLAKSDPPVHRD
jgi:hypothetical protein